MACDTFIKIAQKCRRHFIQVQVGEVMPFIDEILNNINTIICDLQPQQVSRQQIKPNFSRAMIGKDLQSGNHCSASPQNVDILKDPETVKQLGSILKTNVRACKAVGHPFVIQLGRIYLDMLNVYKCLSENISAAIQTNGKGTHIPVGSHGLHVGASVLAAWLIETKQSCSNSKHEHNKVSLKIHVCDLLKDGISA
ncbi:Exportin-1 [Goodea atripinnis]|uniref:Exportin-1 n=1 Tax=Goodea atripinnis TaxID=208336 RepID=A0ABV0PWB5_9TELE